MASHDGGVGQNGAAVPSLRIPGQINDPKGASAVRPIEKIQGEFRTAERELVRCMDKRDEWIAAMRDEGATLRAIGEAAQLTAEGVQEVLRRAGGTARKTGRRGARAPAAVRDWTSRAWVAARRRDALAKELLDTLSDTHSLAEIARLVGVGPTNLVYMASERRQRLQRPPAR